MGGDFKTYTRYSWTADEEQKKKVLGVSNGRFLRGVVGRGNSLFNFLKGGHLKKKFGKPWFR